MVRGIRSGLEKNVSGRDYAQKAVDLFVGARSHVAFATLGCKWIEVLDSNAQHKEAAKMASHILAAYASAHTVMLTIKALYRQCVEGLSDISNVVKNNRCGFGAINFSQVKKGLAGTARLIKNIATLLLFANKQKWLTLLKGGRDYAVILSRFSNIVTMHSLGASLTNRISGVALGKKDLNLEAAADIALDFKSIFFLGLDLLCYTNIVAPATVLVLNTASAGYGLWKMVAKQDLSLKQIGFAQAECRLIQGC